MYTNKQLIENALKRVNALTGTQGKLYKDHVGFCVVEPRHILFKETTRTAGEMLAYLHGIEDSLTFRKRYHEEIQRKVDEDMKGKVYDHPVVKVDASKYPADMFNW